MIKYKQQSQYDCCLAALTSMFELDYYKTFPEEFLKEIEEAKGTHGKNVDRAFEYAGLHKDIDYDAIWVPSTVPNSFPFHMIWGRKALLQVPSVNFPKTSHMIAWDGREVWDPSNLQVYKFLDHRCVIEWIWYFDEMRKK